METRKLITADEASKSVFNGLRSGWSLLQDAKIGRLPSVRIGRRVFFEENSLLKFIDAQLESSFSQEIVAVEQEQADSIGISKIA